MSDKTIRVNRPEWEFLHSENRAGETIADTTERLLDELEMRRNESVAVEPENDSEGEPEAEAEAR